MKNILQWLALALAATLLAACSNAPSIGGLPSVGGLFQGGNDDAISVKHNKPHGPQLKYAAVIHLSPYADERKAGNPRKIGTGGDNVMGMSGNDIVVDQDVSTMVAGAIGNALDNAGFQVVEAQNSNAQFDVSGSIKELTYNVKERDEVSIVVETTLKETATGTVLWSGIVTEKSSRFAGVSGDDKSDVTRYLKKELGVVTQKTVDAVSAALVAAHPEMLNLIATSKPVPGVTVLVAPTAAPAAQNGAPAPATATSVTSTRSAYTPHASESNGLLLVNTNPSRAKIYLDGVYFGLSPMRIEVDPGTHFISVKLVGYKMVAEKISVRKGDSTEMNLDLEH